MCLYSTSAPANIVSGITEGIAAHALQLVEVCVYSDQPHPWTFQDFMHPGGRNEAAGHFTNSLLQIQSINTTAHLILAALAPGHWGITALTRESSFPGTQEPRGRRVRARSGERGDLVFGFGRNPASCSQLPSPNDP